MLNEDNFSVNTETDHDMDDIQEEVSHFEEHPITAERVINTPRRAEPSTKIIKVMKSSITLRKVNPQWLESYRNQEAERYRHPLKPWEFTLADKSM